MSSNENLIDNILGTESGAELTTEGGAPIGLDPYSYGQPTGPTSIYNPLDYQPQRFYPFGMPYEQLGQWLLYDPTQGPYTYTISPGFTLGSLYFPNLTSPVQIFAGTSNLTPLTPFYTTGSGGAEVVPIPSGLSSITLYAVSLSGAVMPFFITSALFDPQKSTPTNAAVSSVGATAPITSTGGPNPVIGMTLPLPVVDGGTGNSAPSLVAGTNIQITGTWPNQTINATLSSAYVGSVTAVPPLSSSGGLNPSIALSVPLAVTYGGTGTTTPALIGGTGIVVTGSWPNQTIALASSTQPIYNYNTSAYLSGGYVVSGSATSSTGGMVTITTNYPNAVLSAVANLTGGVAGTVSVTISGKNVTFTTFNAAGTATAGLPFSFELTGN